MDNKRTKTDVKHYKSEPTELQIEKWEDEGGAIPEYSWHENDPWSKKVRLFFKKMLEKFSSNVAPKKLQTKNLQHHY